MFRRTFVRASNAEGLRRRMRMERAGERKIALQKRWYVGGLAAVVASSLIFSGMSPAVAEEVTPTDPAATTETTPAETTPTDAATPPADETATDPAATETPPPDDTAAAPDATAPDATVPDATAPDAAARGAAAPLAAPLAAPPVAAALVCGGLNGGFEIDGNYTPGDCGGNKDWTNVGYQSTANVGTYKVMKDNSDPTTWDLGGGTPPKIDFERVYSYAETIGNDYFLNVAWERDQTSGTGGYVIEVTNAGSSSGNGVPQPNRSAGGAVFYITTHGSNPPELLQACVYTSQANYPGTCSSGTGGFIGAVNNEALTSPFGAAIEIGGFFEVGLNVTQLTGGAVHPGCPAAADATLYMRSFTGENFGPTGNLKGWVGPMTVNPPSTCGSLTIEKKSVGGAFLAGATFTVSPNPTTGSGSVQVVTDASGKFVFSNNVRPGSYTVTETIAPAGYLLPTSNNPQMVTVGEKESKTLTFVDPLGSGSWTKRSGDANGPLLGGATFSLAATGGAAAAAPWAASFPKSVVDNGANDPDPVAGQITVIDLPTGTYQVTETAAPAGYVLDPTPKSFTISQQTPNASIATPFVNIPYVTVTLTKHWVNSFAGDTANLAITGAASNNGTSTAPVDGPVVSVSVAPGSNLNLAEVMGGQNRGLYGSTLSCVGASVTANTGVSGSIVVPQWPASANGVQCTFTNTALTRTVTLQKQWVDGFQGDSAALTLTNSNGNTSVSNGQAGSWLDAAHAATATVRVGDTVNFGEQLTTPSGASYGTTFACTPTQTLTGGDKAYTLDRMPDANLVCTFTNTAQKATVTLKKAWVNSFEDDVAHLEITGAAGDSADAVAPEGNGTSPQIAQVSVRIGDKVTLSEALDDGNQGEYTSTWSCTDGSSGEGTSIPQLTVTQSVECTIVNTAKTIDISVNKTWVNAFGGDTADLSLNGDTETSTAGNAGQLIVNETDSDVVVTTIRVGDSVNIAEALGAGNRGTYTSSYVCTGHAAQGNTTTVPEFTAPAVDVDCTFTNTAVTVGVLLKKNWIGALVGDKADLSVTPEAGPLAQALSTVLIGSPNDFLDNLNIVSINVRIGAVIPMSESIVGSGVYASSFTCTAGDTTAVGDSGRAFTLKVTGAAICRFVNVSQVAHLTVIKNWVNSQDGDSAQMAVTGGATGGATSTTTGGTYTDLDNTISADATIGQQVTVSEVVGVEHGDPSDYTSTLVCVDSNDNVLVDVSARQGSFTMPGVPVECEFTNTAELPSLTLLKIVSGAPGVSDTNWQLIGAPMVGPMVTNLAGGDVPKTDVAPGVDYTLSEDLIGLFPGSNEFAPGEWACVDQDGPVTLTDSVPGEAGLPGLDKGEDVVCTIVNAHVAQGYAFDKSVVSSVQQPDGTWVVTYSITVHNNSVVVPITYDLNDALLPPANITYLDASWTGPTSGTWDLPGNTVAVLATNATLPPYDSVAGNDAVYTVAVHVAVATPPVNPTDCSVEGTGIAVKNSAKVTSEGVTTTDEACGTVHYDDVSIVKTSDIDPDGGSVEPGDTFEYTLTVTNNGTRDATNVVVTDEIPARLEVTGVTLPAGWTNDNDPEFVDADNVLSVSTPTLAYGETVDIVVSVTFTETPVPPVEPGDETSEPPAPIEEFVNTACVDADLDQDGTNDCSTVTIPVREITAVVWTKCVADAPFLGWTIAKSQALLDEEINFLWTPDSGTPTTDPAEIALTQPGGTAMWSNEIAWPGAAFTPSGVSIDYPGWRPIQASDIVPGSNPTQYYYPGTTDIISAADQPDFVFNGLILDDSELDYAWRFGSTITFAVNPELVFHTEYPEATPECFVARHSNVQIEKTASVDKTEPGKSFTYSLAVANVSDDGAAEAVVVTDTIPSDIKITDVTWPGKGDAAVFPNWQSCAVSGQNGDGYGGKLTCVLFGPLQPQGANSGASAAPTITLAATVNPASKSSSITNVAVVDYHTFGNPDDPGRDSDDAIVLLSALPATGGDLPPLLVILGLLALLAGSTMIVVVRRRRGEAKPTV